MAGSAQDDIAYLTALVRKTDRVRYYSTLFARQEIRSDLLALYGFAAEIARIPDQVTEPRLGEIRLRWWRDALTGGSEFSRASDSPALRAISSVVSRRSFAIEGLVALIDAGNTDLYSDPPAGMADIETYFDQTQGTIFRLAAAICGAGPELEHAARQAGIAYGLARRLSVTAADHARNRTIFPSDLLNVERLTAADVFATESPDRLTNVAAALAQLARHHLRIARDALAAAPRAIMPAFLPIATVDPLLAEVGRLGPDLLQRPASPSDLKLLLGLGGHWLRGRV
jgi:phytoene synthase